MRRGDAVARRYARALFKLGEERGDVAAVLAELGELVACVQGSASLGRVLFTPIHPREQRLGVVRDLAGRLGLCDEVRAFAMILVEENRTGRLPQIRDALEELVDRAAGRVKAEVTSARALDPEEVGALRAALSRRTSAEVTLELDVDPDLIGGVVARVGDLLLDGSVRTQLTSLGGRLRRGSA